MKTSKKVQLRYALATTLAMSASLPGLPVWADGTPVGVPITNKATATFTDGTTTYDTTSNEIAINVAEIAGIALEAQTPSNPNPIVGSTLYVDFIITNIGNDPSQFFIPGVATLSDATNFSQDGPIKIVAVNGINLATTAFVDVPATGASTGTLLSTTPSQGSIAAENLITGIAKGTITIRVPIAVNPSSPTTATTTVTIGETATANATPQTDTRSSDRTGNINDTRDLYTVDNTAIGTATTGETNTTPPANGTREAMATSLLISVGARPQAFATVLKTASYGSGTNPNALTDDLLTYALALRVENPTPPPTGLAPADLHGTLLTVTGAPASARYVLVSDAIPAGLQLATANPTATGLAASWTPVYSQTPIGAGSTALNATWTTTRPASNITRVGFIYDTVANGALPRGTSPAGNLITGFTIVTTPTATFTGGTIANIAQTFGQSGPGAVVPGTPTQIVYDESGDPFSNNGLDGTNPADPTLPTGGGGITDGVADPTKDGSDPGNNSGADGGGNGTNPKGGEDTIVSFAATPLNGPAGQPGASGPTGTNDDYTNKSIVIPSGIDPLTPLTDAQTLPKIFDNTVQNTSGGSQVISLVPKAPTTLTDLPIGTLVTISNATPTTAATITATYEYNGTTFVFDSGTGGTSATVPVRLTIPAGGTANYQTIVDLPGSTADVPVLQFKSYPVPIVAFIDGGSTPNGLPDTTEPSNITIDRLYTNYLQLYKEARMLEATGLPVTGTAGSFGIDPTALSAAATPGRIIEYRITYRNVSSTGGTGSALLPANNLVITENGSAGSNTWGTTTLDPKYPAQAIGSAIDTLGTIGSIAVTSTPLNITEYKSTVSSVGPGITGYFIFQRQIK
jgi:hypothetical protein